MTENKYKFESGVVDIIEYTRKDYNTRAGIRGLVYDIYHHTNLKDSIHWILFAEPNDGFTLENLLDDYTKQEGKDKIIMCLAGSVCHHTISAFGEIDDGVENTEKELGYILNAFFYNIIFNRKMHNSCGSRYYCIYSNDKADDFITENTGSADSDKIINRVISSGKL